MIKIVFVGILLFGCAMLMFTLLFTKKMMRI